jgi:hypothetical protein
MTYLFWHEPWANPRPDFVTRGAKPVRVPEEMRKCIAFLGVREGEEFRPRATGFFVSYLQFQHRFIGLVTAEHVVSGLLTRDQNIYVRINLVNGDVAEVSIPPGKWRFYPDAAIEATDVAICPIADYATADDGTRVAMDIQTIALNGPNALVAVPEIMAERGIERGIGVGDDIFIIGLFRSHYGKERNFPVVRVGNLAAVREEPIKTKYAGYIDAYLIEAHSIGGLSGSPAFVAIPFVRIREGVDPQSVGTVAVCLGLVHGHFDIEDLNSDVVLDTERASTAGIQTGMGVVVPVEKIIATMEHPDFVEDRRRYAMEQRKGGATPDLAEGVGNQSEG